MNSDVKIKVCGMRQGQNIRSVSKLKPDYLGLIFYPKSPRFVELKKASSILNAFPQKVEKIGVFVNEPLPELINTCNSFKIKTVQLHGSENPGYCSELKELGFTVIKAFGVNEQFDFNQLAPYTNSCDFYLFDTKSEKHGGTGKKFNWQLLQKFDNSKPIFLSGGIGPDDADELLKIEDLNIYALDLNSKFETEPALKNVEFLEKFIKNIRHKNV